MSLKITGYLIKIDGAPATVGLPHVNEKGILVKAKPGEQPVIISRGTASKPVYARRRADAVIRRTIAAIQAIRTSVIHDWPIVQDALGYRSFTVHPIYQEKAQ